MEAIYFNWLKETSSRYFFILTSQAREAIMGLDINRLFCDQSIENLIEERDKFYLKDCQYSAYEAWEEFEIFCWPKPMNISNYIIKF